MPIVILHTAEPRPDDPPFDFEAWQARRLEQRQARRLELETALAAGKVVSQAGTFWTVDAVISTRFGPASSFRPFVDRCMHAGYLAEHLENRENGFGFDTFILSTKGDRTP
jgi:hypothetical protein